MTIEDTEGHNALIRANAATREAMIARDDAVIKEGVLCGLEMEAKKAWETIGENEGFNSDACEVARIVMLRAIDATEDAAIAKEDFARKEAVVYGLEMKAKAVVYGKTMRIKAMYIKS